MLGSRRMQLPLRALRASVGYLRKHPTELFYVARHAARFRTVIPIDALRWMADNLGGKGAPQDVVIGTHPPAITFAATINLMGTKVRAGAELRVEEIRLNRDELRVTLRLADVTLDALEKSDSPVYTLLMSGALDLSKPGNLANFMPKRPAALIEAVDDRIVVDLLKVPKIANDRRFRRVLDILTPILPMHDIRAEDDHLILSWRPRVSGIPRALLALKNGS